MILQPEVTLKTHRVFPENGSLSYLCIVGSMKVLIKIVHTYTIFVIMLCPCYIRRSDIFLF